MNAVQKVFYDVMADRQLVRFEQPTFPFDSQCENHTKSKALLNVQPFEGRLPLLFALKHLCLDVLFTWYKWLGTLCGLRLMLFLSQSSSRCFRAAYILQKIKVKFRSRVEWCEHKSIKGLFLNVTFWAWLDLKQFVTKVQWSSIFNYLGVLLIAF